MLLYDSIREADALLQYISHFSVLFVALETVIEEVFLTFIQQWDLWWLSHLSGVYKDACLDPNPGLI